MSFFVVKHNTSSGISEEEDLRLLSPISISTVVGMLGTPLSFVFTSFPKQMITILN